MPKNSNFLDLHFYGTNSLLNTNSYLLPSIGSFCFTILQPQEHEPNQSIGKEQQVFYFLNLRQFKLGKQTLILKIVIFAA